MKVLSIAQWSRARYPLLGPVLWITSIQYFIIQIIVARSWPVNYNFLDNTISDLGNTVCGSYNGRFICSPLFWLMNISFFVLGSTMFFGSCLMYYEFSKSRRSAVGFSCMAVAGLGSILVGLFPENTISFMHILGASLPFLLGNIGMIVLGKTLDVSRSLRYFTLLSGMTGLVSLVLFLVHYYLGLGIGGMERVVAYPQTVWLIIFGLYASKCQLRLSAFNKNHK